MDLLCFCSVLCLLCLCARLFICALWSPAAKGLTSWLSFVMSTVSLSLSHCYPGSGVVLDLSIPDLCTLTYFHILSFAFSCDSEVLFLLEEAVLTIATIHLKNRPKCL